MKNATVIYVVIVIALVLVGLISGLTLELIIILSALLSIAWELFRSQWSKIARQSAYRIFIVKSSEWMWWRLAGVGFILFNQAKHEMEVMNVIAMVSILVLGILFVLYNRKHVYSYDAIAIENLNTGDKIRFTKITNIAYSNERVVIDIKSKKNALVINRSDLQSPGWLDFTQGLRDLQAVVNSKVSVGFMTS